MRSSCGTRAACTGYDDGAAGARPHVMDEVGAETGRGCGSAALASRWPCADGHRTVVWAEPSRPGRGGDRGASPAAALITGRG